MRHDTWFDTIAVDGVDADAALAAAAPRGINLRRVDDDAVGITLDETTTLDVVERVARGVRRERPIDDAATRRRRRPARRRGPTTPRQPVFHRYHTEHEMLRYLRRLADRDLALDRTMIPLGSCTMKLNATTEMEPITWPEFADVHPFAPADQTGGYARS